MARESPITQSTEKPWFKCFDAYLRAQEMANDHCICQLPANQIAQSLMALPAVALTLENSNQVPSAAGLYAIHNNQTDQCLWVGRTDNLRDRIFNQHYTQGRDDRAGSDLIRWVQRQIFNSTDPATRPQAQHWISQNCVVRWLVLASERQLRQHLRPIWGTR